MSIYHSWGGGEFEIILAVYGIKNVKLWKSFLFGNIFIKYNCDRQKVMHHRCVVTNDEFNLNNLIEQPTDQL